jgi:energy-coupling factor transport system permease/ATP-binding protein
MLAGPSGAGKSTLLRGLAGLLLTADVGDLTGTVRLDGAAAGSRPGQVGLLLQDPADAMVAATAGRDTAFGPENAQLPRPQIWSRVEAALAAVRFPYDAGHASAPLSGGEGQRLSLAGALALHPGLLLLDEPTAMLDPEAADEVREAILATAVGRTLVVVDHQLGPWLPAVDRLVVLSVRGEVVADGPPEWVLSRQGDRLAELGVWVPGLPPPAPVPLEPRLSQPWRSAPPSTPPSHLLRADDVAVAGRLAPTSVTVEPAQVVALTGPSGSGKSTLLGVLTGQVRPTSGRVRAGPSLAGPLGPDPQGWRSRDLALRMSWVGQHPEPGFVAATVAQEAGAVRLGAADPTPAPPAEAVRARAEDLLHAFGLTELAAVDPHRLSGGEQRRVALVTALAQGAQVLFADEPTLGQDRHTWAAVAGALDAARRAGAAVVVATHDRCLLDALPGVRLDLSAPRRRLCPPGADRWPPAARCGPLAILLVSLLAVLGSVFVRDWRVGLVTVAAQLALAPLAVRRVRTSAARLAPGLLAALSIGWSSWLLGGHDLATGVTAGLRILVLVLPGALLTAYLDPSRLGDDLAQRLHLPARPVVATVAALQRAEDLGRVWAEAAWARRVRGLGAGRSVLGRVREAAALTFVLLVQSIRQAGRMAVAMDARGFAGARRRTWAEPSRWTRADTVLVVLGLVSALPLVLDVTWV